jgi:peptide/nickel transport system ATP-binding protein
MTAAMDIILEVKNLSIGFYVDGRVITAVDDISFQVYRGETLAILGESGSGKSVSAAAIMDLVERPPGEIISGEILFQGHNLFAMSRRERLQINGKRIAIIFQDPMVHLNPVYSVGWQIAETFRAHNAVPKGGAWREAVRLMERVGISKAGERAHQYPHEFSGGQRQRIMIAMALALRPELLIADEPTTALDVTIQAQILELLRELQKEMGMSVILITHDLNVAASVADRLVVMYGGKVVETGDVRAVFDNPQHSYTRKLLSAAIGTQVSELSRPRRQIGGDPLLSVRDLSKTYVLPSRGLIPKWRQIDAVKGVSFDIRVGETLGLVGESGSGKSTVARMLLRLNEPSAGSAHYAGQDIFGMNERELLAYRRNVQMIFQDPYASLNPRMSVEKIIAEPWVIHRDLLPRSGWARRVEALLDMVGLDPGLRLRYPHQFSGGQRQRIAIARALACEPKIIICDEAVSALDVSIQAQIMALLAALRDKLGLSFMFITHDLPLARSFADTIIVMKDGHIVEAGPADQVFSAPAHIYTKTLLSSIPTPKWTGEDGAAVAPQHA